MIKDKIVFNGFYSSNFGQSITPIEPGFYISYRNVSGDSSFIKVDRMPEGIQDARQMLHEIDPDEIYGLAHGYHVTQEDIDSWRESNNIQKVKLGNKELFVKKITVELLPKRYCSDKFLSQNNPSNLEVFIMVEPSGRPMFRHNSKYYILKDLNPDTSYE